MAIASLVLGISSLLFCVPAIPGLIFGILSLKKIGRSKGQLGGEALAIAGIAVSAGALLLGTLYLAILYPVFSNAREKARQTACLSNMKQLSLGLIMYAQDWDEKAPPADTWSDAIDPYVKSRKIYVCPDALDLKCGYAFNDKLTSDAFATMTNPAETLLFFESNLGWNGHGTAEALPAKPRHKGGDNFAYCDGHCKWVRRGRAPALQWLPQLETKSSSSQGTDPRPENLR